MGEVVKFKRPSMAERHKGNTLCRSGFHKWQILKEQQFDVKQGQLVPSTNAPAVQKPNLRLYSLLLLPSNKTLLTF